MMPATAIPGTTIGTWRRGDLPLQPGDVIGLNTDGDAATQEITFRVEEIRTVQGSVDGPRQEQTDAAVLREIDVRRKKRVLIGRSDDCDIKLVSDRVSRHHCEILYKDGQFEVRDLGSTNGTYVDGARVSRAALRNGAVINVPTQVFAFTGGFCITTSTRAASVCSF